ncbi:MAG: hypothetical protein AVDCRST_MAG31-815 [uncultured Sphingomonas sp.]|uniref:Transposase DDE domain-containing protein n=1 Tax=uncultured Sphingomonas sp. TaxID=158754 RepID=A0A6J4SYL8_9SPHN|nr:MAG: hypothetical protein AVDCRST_MAG31-815 [uncultured Sphingomonas sp.]
MVTAGGDHRVAHCAARRTGRGGQPRYSALAIATALRLRAVFRLALRRTVDLAASISDRSGHRRRRPEPRARFRTPVPRRHRLTSGEGWTPLLQPLHNAGAPQHCYSAWP